MRLFDESVKASQANCVDGAVLLAAMLRKIGLHPALVMMPGHMFLAVDIDDETTIGLEKNADKFEGDDLRYQLIDIAEARSAGILPITYTKKD